MERGEGERGAREGKEPLRCEDYPLYYEVGASIARESITDENVDRFAHAIAECTNEESEDLDIGFKAYVKASGAASLILKSLGKDSPRFFGKTL